MPPTVWRHTASAKNCLITERRRLSFCLSVTNPGMTVYGPHLNVFACDSISYNPTIPPLQFGCFSRLFIVSQNVSVSNRRAAKCLCDVIDVASWKSSRPTTQTMVAFFNSFRKGPVVCRGLDLDLSGNVAKKTTLTRKRGRHAHSVFQLSQ